MTYIILYYNLHYIRFLFIFNIIYNLRRAVRSVYFIEGIIMEFRHVILYFFFHIFYFDFHRDVGMHPRLSKIFNLQHTKLN